MSVCMCVVQICSLLRGGIAERGGVTVGHRCMSVCMCVVQICSLLRGGIAERGGVRVGHRIIEINGISVVAVSHDRIVNLLMTSVGQVS